jgi:proteasome lid subunit RPN8/RPN11
MTVQLSRATQARIFAQMAANYPHEGGGFLLGSVGAMVEIHDILPIDNVFEEAERHHRYAMTPQDWMRIEDEADARGFSIVGYYHSHPDSPAIPSEYDREYALPNFIYVITAVLAGKPDSMHAWRLQDNRSQFDEQTLVITDTNQ